MKKVRLVPFKRLIIIQWYNALPGLLIHTVDFRVVHTPSVNTAESKIPAKKENGL